MLREKELKLLEDLKTDNARKTEEIRQLRNNQLVGQASGEEIVTITDGALVFANILEETEIEVEGAKRKAYVVKLPQGLSKQKVRQGYNKFNIQKWAENNLEVNNGSNLTINSTEISWATTTTDSFTKTFVSSDNTANKQQVVEKFGLEVIGNETKTICWENPNKIECRALVSFLDENYNFISLLELGVSTEEKIIKNFTIPENSKYLTYIFGAIKADINVVYRKIMILDGTYTAENLPEYEEYGESPSIEFPSPIKNIRAWNLFNAYIPKQNIGGVDVEFDEDIGVLTLNGTCTETKQISFDRSKNKIKTKANTKYTFEVFKVSGKYTFGGTSEHGESSVQLWDNSSGTWKYPYQLIFNSFDSANKIFVSHTYDVDILYNQVQFKLEAGDVFDDFKIKIQFTEGDSKEYLPCGDIFINMKNKNYVSSDINDWEEGHYSQTTGLKEPYANRLRLKEPIKVQPDTAYYANTFSNNTYNLVLREYDKYKNIINNIDGATDGGIFTTTKDTQFISVSLYNRLDAGEPLYFEDYKKLFEAGTIKPFLCLNSESNKDYVEHQEQNYNLHIGDLELNGMGDIRDSFVVELDNSYSYKKVKKLYLKKKYNEIIFDIETINNTGFAQGYTNIEKNIYQYRTIRNYITDLLVNPDLFNIKDIALCNYKKKNGPNDNINSVLNDNLFTVSGNKEIVINSNKATYADFKNELIELNNNGNPLKILYPLETPELIDVTDNVELVKDVEYLINNFKTFKELTHVEAENGYIDLEYVKSTKLAFKNMQQQIDNIQAVMLEGGTNNA